MDKEEIHMEKEMERVKAALEDFGKKVIETVKKGKGEADKVTRIAQVKIEIGSLNRQQKDLYQELGELFYRNLGKPGKKGEADIAETVSHIREVEKNIGGLNRTLKAIRADKPAPKKRPPKAAAAKAQSTAPKRRGRPPKSASASKG
jgi:seryl-tRNA synthetase